MLDGPACGDLAEALANLLADGLSVGVGNHLGIRHLEIASRSLAANRHDRTAGRLQNTFGDASKHDLRKATSPVGADNNQVSVVCVSRANGLVGRIAGEQEHFHTHA